MVYGEGGTVDHAGRFQYKSVNRYYADYSLGEPNSYTLDFDTPGKSLISLLESIGCYVTNPMGEKPEVNAGANASKSGYFKILADWEQAQNNTITSEEKYVILIKK